MVSIFADKLNIYQLGFKNNLKKTNEIMILSTTKPEDKGTNLIVGLITTHVLKGLLKKY